MQTFRTLINLLESPDTTTLYRGDLNKIDQFDISKTDLHALFGQGIYLTSDADVARDYSFARTHDLDSHRNFFGEPFPSQKAAIADYLQHIIRDDLHWKETREAIMEPFRNATWTRDRDADDADQQLQVLQDQAKKAVLDAYKKLLQEAKNTYKEQVKNFVFVKSTKGEWKLIKREWQGQISHFEIPNSYLRKCLHGDRPLSHNALMILRDIIYRINPDGYIDFRDEDGKGIPFDQWVKVFRRGQSWHVGGGDMSGGKNPSLEQIMNGTFSGFHIRKSATQEIIRGFQQLGYTGIEYDGGVRTAGDYTRGGGGLLHRAFVFWDAPYINSCLIRTIGAQPDPHEDGVMKGLTPSSLLKSHRDKR